MKKVLIGLFSSFVVVILMVSYVIFTENGLQLLVRALEKISMGNLQVEDVRGKLTGKFAFEKFSYVSSDTDFRINKFEFNWNPTALRHGNLHVLSCVIKDVEFNDMSTEDASENDEIFLSLPNFKLPLGIVLENLQVQNIQVFSAGETMVEIDRVDLQMSGEAARIYFNTVYLQGNDYEVSLSGSVGVDQGWPVDITGKWRYQIEGIPELKGTINVVDSIKDAGINLMLEAPCIAQLDGRMQIEDGGLRWQGQLQAIALDPGTISSEINGLLDIYLVTDGAWKGDSISTSLSIERIEGSLFAQPIELNGTAKYDGEQLEIDTLVIKSGEAGVTIKGRVDETLDLSYVLHSLETNHLLPWLTGVINGEGTASGKFATPVIKAVLSGKDFAGQGAEVGDVRAELKAEIFSDLQKSKVDAVIKVEDVSIEGNQIDSGVFDVKGSLEKHRLHLEVLQEYIAVELSADGGWHENQWMGSLNTLDLTYSGKAKETIYLSEPATVKAGADAVDVENMCLRHESSVLCLNGQMRGKGWRADIDLKEFNPGNFLEEWPGAVNVQAQAKGQITDDALEYAINVLSLSGMVKGVSLAGAGKVKQSGNLLRFQDIKVAYGDAQLSAEGLLGEEYDIDLQVNIPELKKFVADSGGTINASGALYGTREQPVIDLDFNGRDVAFADFYIRTLHGDVGVDLHDEGRVEAILRGTDISSNALDIPAISLLANGTAANHLFMINADTALGTAEIQGQGSYGTAWRGVLESATLALKEQGTWALQKDAAIEIGREKSSLESLCLQAGDALVCLEGKLLDGQKWSAQADMKSIPLRVFKNAGLGNFPFQGELQGTAKASGDSAGVSAFRADVNIPEMLLQDKWQEDIQYILSDNVVSAVLDGPSLQVKLGSRFQENGELTGTFSINNIIESGGDISALPLAGDIHFRVEDMTFVSILTEARFQPKGRLLGELDISGNLGKPVVKGDVTLQEGEVFVADLGVLLEGISIKVLSNSDTLKFILEAQSGPGNILGDGTVSIDSDYGFVVSSTITGEEFEIMNTDEYLFRVSPELQIEYGGIRDSIVGSLAVPYGRITLKGGTDTVTTTDDVIIIDAKEPVKKRDSQFYADIAVNLGEDVQIDAFGLKSDLIGAVRLINEPGKNLAAKGEVIVVNGEFSLYSAELNITRGRLVFSGGNVENPGVDFRAQRKIEKTLVGVDVSGTARDLDFQLFSEPPMEESNILGYILFGRALYDSSGAETSFVASAANALGIRGVNTVTNQLGRYVPVDDIYLEGDANEEDLSIVLGKHLTKDLFIGYGHNLFEEVGEFKVRYQLGNNFSIETNSSVESTSGDIVYTIER